MASVDIVHTNDRNLLFYNVDAAVGKDCPNRRPDVLLVQYLLTVCTKAPKLAYIRISAMGDEKYMKITGTWEDWDVYLLNFQNDLKQRGKLILRDGRVDPVAAGRPRGLIHHMQYTILYLNLGYSALRPNDFPRMAEVGDCPGELRPLLKAQFVEG